MASRTAFIYSDALLDYDFGESHPLRPERLNLTFELVKAQGTFDLDNVSVVRPKAAESSDLLLFHKERYIETVKRFSEVGYGLLDSGDTPAYKGCYAFNPVGGLHHAHPDRASGFCIFNDPALCIAYLKKKHGLPRIMYLDIDAHHGDGVMYGFYSDPSVLDIDFHEDGRYLFPGSGFTNEIGEGEGKGYKVNIPVPPFTYDGPYLNAFREIVPRLTRAYKPEIILMQCGADAHANDLLAHLDLTTHAYGEIVSTIHQLAHEVCNGRLVLFGGGGYNLGNTVRCWAIAFNELAEARPKEEIPKEWLELYRNLGEEESPRFLHDKPELRKRDEEMSKHVAGIVADLQNRIPMLSKA
jgi:acetoin utilization protein AcuC